MNSLRDFLTWRGCPAFALAAILATVANGCGRTTSNEADSARPLFPAPMTAGWGFIDDRGKTVIAARYEAVMPFSEGLAGAKREGRWGFINRAGTEVIPFIYSRVESFHGGVAIVNTGLPEHPVGVIDSGGAWITQPMFRSLTAADGPEGLLFGEKQPGEGPSFYDRSGNVVLGPYSLAFPFSQGRARVKSRDGEWIIDSAGNFIARQPVGLEGIRFSEGLIAIRRDRKLGYMDLDGNIAIEPRYDQGGEFSEGLAAVQLEGRWMFIDKSGATAVQLPRDVIFAERISDGLSLATSAAQPDRKFGYLNKNGQWAVKPEWDDANPFHDGLAYVGIWRNGIVAYIDQRGKRVWQGRGSQQ
ncbi:MAG TPA: WG repeat-containing protein [Candidatus Acidoferrum sp.]|nr:WG repeat-containing protein [Candidatus Acidoferrum sp.]